MQFPWFVTQLWFESLVQAKNFYLVFQTFVLIVHYGGIGKFETIFHLETWDQLFRTFSRFFTALILSRKFNKFLRDYYLNNAYVCDRVFMFWN